MQPTNVGTRMQYVDAEYTANHGLFVRWLAFGDNVQPLSEVRYIPTLDYTANQDNMDMDLRINLDEVALEIDLTRSFKGYSGLQIGPIMKLVQEAQRKRYEARAEAQRAAAEAEAAAKEEPATETPSL